MQDQAKPCSNLKVDFRLSDIFSFIFFNLVSVELYLVKLGIPEKHESFFCACKLKCKQTAQKQRQLENREFVLSVAPTSKKNNASK